jgi:Arc/MetJ family transcription regulator
VLVGVDGTCCGRRHAYGCCAGRTTIDIDDALVEQVMHRHGLRTKREAVDLALRRLVGPPLTPDFLAGLRGIGWEGDLDQMRARGAAT